MVIECASWGRLWLELCRAVSGQRVGSRAFGRPRTQILSRPPGQVTTPAELAGACGFAAPWRFWLRLEDSAVLITRCCCARQSAGRWTAFAGQTRAPHASLSPAFAPLLSTTHSPRLARRAESPAACFHASSAVELQVPHRIQRGRSNSCRRRAEPRENRTRCRSVSLRPRRGPAGANGQAPHLQSARKPKQPV